MAPMEYAENEALDPFSAPWRLMVAWFLQKATPTSCPPDDSTHRPRRDGVRPGFSSSRPGCRSASGVPAPFAFFCPPALGVALPLLRLFLLLLFLPGPCREDRAAYRRGHRKQYPELR